ncbi:MAG: sigma-54 dependent transcriptional regulator [Verrucomicrobiota bacterium]|nr:sigma-54 dependent transcriptional regulator [Verrucomicrobiota bacterium]
MSLDKILCLDDDKLVCTVLREIGLSHRIAVTVCHTIASAEQALLEDTFDLAFLDLRLPDGNSMELVERLGELKNAPLFVVMTGHASIESAVNCMKAGAFDYILKPFNASTIEMALEKAAKFSQMLSINRYYAEALNQDWNLLGRSSSLKTLRQLIAKVAPTDATVLITGESGTGKEVVARELHAKSPRRKAPFIKVNCAALSETLMESEFFGHEKGAFTGASEKRMGRFELANGGSLLLDEISEVSPQLQAKLLRVLQEKEFERVGGTRSVKVDVRIIATSNRHLEEEVKSGRFRKDLFYRLSVFPLHIEPLRERNEDKILLATHFLQQFGRKHGLEKPMWSERALQAIASYSWPGNVRELQNTVERAVILAQPGKPLSAGLLNFTISDALPEGSKEEPTVSAILDSINDDVPGKSLACEDIGDVETTATDTRGDHPIAAPKETSTVSDKVGASGMEPLDEIEKIHILKVLQNTGGNRVRAAEILNISVRTLRNKLHLYEDAGMALPTFD